MNKYLALLASLFLATGCARAQLISLGVKAGVPMTDATYGSQESRPFIIGPSVEVKLPARFAVEVSALYRRIGTGSQSGSADDLSQPYFLYRLRGNSWEFPVLGKYYLRPRDAHWQPFVGAGFAFRFTRFHQEGVYTVLSDTPSNRVAYQRDYTSDTTAGAVTAAGVRIAWGRLALTPEFRYTYWGSSGDMLKRNQAAFLLGLSY